MKRWLALPIGLALVLVAGWLVLSGPQPDAGGSEAAAKTANRPSASRSETAGPSAEIDDASRERLEQILRDAEDEP